MHVKRHYSKATFALLLLSFYICPLLHFYNLCRPSASMVGCLASTSFPAESIAVPDTL